MIDSSTISKRPLILLAGLLFAWMVVMNIRPIQDPDFWWHLASGRYMVMHRTIPKTDVFSLTARGSLWVNTYWLQEIPTYLIYRFTGFSGVILFNSFLIATLVFLIGFADPIHSTSWKLRLAGVAWIFVAAHPRDYGWGEKASLVTFGFLGLLTYTLRTGKWPMESRLAKTWPLFFMIWANTHRGFILGLLILAGYVIERCLSGAKNRSQLFGWALSCAAATLVNPWGFRVYGMGWQDFRLSPTVVSGWASTPFFHLEIFWITLAIFWCLVGWKVFRGDSPGFGFFWASAILSYMSVRYASIYPYFILWAVPWLVSVFSRRFPIVASAAILLIVLLIIAVFSWNLHPAFGVNRRVFPVDAVQFLKENDFHVPFYHDYGLGGYYLWSMNGNPPILVDGRYPAVQGYRDLLPAMIKANRGTPEDFYHFLDSLNIQCAVLQYPKSQFFHRPFAAYFPRDRWALVYWDDQVLIFLRRLPRFQKQIREYEFAGVEPDSDPLFWRNVIWDHFITAEKVSVHRELERNVVIHPDSQKALFWRDFTREQ